MSDGRAFTDYNASCISNAYLQQQYKVDNVHQYRYYLQQNSDKVRLDMVACLQQPDCAFCPVCKKALEYKPDTQN